MVHVSNNGEGQRKLLTFSNGAGNTSRSQSQSHQDPEPNRNHHPDSLLDSIIKTVFEQNPKETSFSDLLLPQQIQEESTVPLYSSHAKNNGFNLSCVIEEEPLLNTMTSTNILRDAGENIDQQPLSGNANLNLNIVSSSSTTSTTVNRTSLLEDTHNSNTLNGNRNEFTSLNTNTTVTSTTAVEEEVVSQRNGRGKSEEKETVKFTTTTKKTFIEKEANGKAAKQKGKGSTAQEKVSQQKQKKGDQPNESSEESDKVPLLASESSAPANRRKSPAKKHATKHESSSSSPPSRSGESTSTTTNTETQQPPSAPASSVKTGKLSNGTKNPALKRVSFGNSKGTMVETLIYDNPVSEDQEVVKTGSTSGNGVPTTPSPTTNGSGGAGPSGCVTTILKTTETNDSIDSTLSGGSTGGSRPPSRVRVTFFESEKPLAVSSPESDFDFDLSHNMTLPGSPITADGSHSYHRQTSGEIGWENPFRPDGDLSKEADQIVELIKEGKPINEENLRSKSPSVLNSTTLSFINSKGGKKGTNGTTNGLEVQRGIVAQSNQAGQIEHVTLKKQKKGCCVVQ